MKAQSIWKKRKFSAFDVFNVILMVVLSAVFLYPLLMELGLSFSSARALVGKTLFLFPLGFTTKSYSLIFSDSTILRYYMNTIIYALGGTILTLVCTALMAYPLTISDFRGKKLISVLLLITMFFGGGLIPSYLTVKSYNMLDTVWAMILPGTISAWNVIIFENFFSTIPSSLRESAMIDGAGHVRILFSIVIPLSKPLLASIALFTIVGYWNDYFNALVYLISSSKMPIQMFLRKVLVSVDMTAASAQGMDMQKMIDMVTANPRTVKAACVIVTIVPVLCVYPFLQKYFTKGMMIGAVKA